MNKKEYKALRRRLFNVSQKLNWSTEEMGKFINNYKVPEIMELAIRKLEQQTK